MTRGKSIYACPCCGKDWMDPRILAIHAGIEDDVGERLTVTSGCRCESHNREVGGSETSSHMRGLAFDVACARSRLRFRIIQSALKRGITRIGIKKDALHLDIDRQKDQRVIWVYN